MSRFRFTRGKTSILGGTILFTGIAWWLTSGPPEPVYEGKKLSWWFVDANDQLLQRQPLTGKELRSLGPGAVAWLSYKAGQSTIRDRMMAFAESNWVRKAYYQINERWFFESSEKFQRVRFESVCALGELGPDAAPAIPALFKALHGPEPDARSAAGESLMRVGKAAWPAITDAMRHDGDLASRWGLLNIVDLHWESYEKPPERLPDFHPTDFVGTVALLGSMTADGNEAIRRLAGEKLEELFTWWGKQPDYEQGVILLVEGMKHMSPLEEQAAADLLAGHDYWTPSATVVPQLIQLAETNDLPTRIHLLGALVVYDSTNPRWMDELHKLSRSPDSKVADAAADALGLSWRPGRKRIEE
jgi:hypothetical protein